MTGSPAPSSFRLAYVPGVTPGKWARTWAERLPDVPLDLLGGSVAETVEALRGGAADAALVRLPIDRTGLSAIPLYTETTVVVVPKDHEVSAVDEVTLGELADYILLHPLDDSLDWPTQSPPGPPAAERPATVADAVELVAAGIGLLAVPQSLARLHHRRDLTYRTLTDAPQSQVALAWLEAQTTELMEEFIGIVRGRTVNSSRGRAAAAAPAKQQRGNPADGRTKPAGKGSSGASAASGASGGKRARGSGKQGAPRRRP